VIRRGVKIPKHQEPRLAELAGEHGYRSARAFAEHLLAAGLRQLGDDGDGPLPRRLDAVVDARGYADRAELVEHLLERGIRAYGEPAPDREKLEERLRGLGYIE